MKLISTLIALTAILSGIQSSSFASEFTDCKKIGSKKYDNQNYVEPWTKKVGWVSVPVFFVTDRTYKCSCYKDKQIEINSKKQLEFGIVNTCAPKTQYLKKKSLQTKLLQLGWKSFDSKRRPSKRELEKTTFPIPNKRFQSELEFWKDLRRYQNRCIRGDKSKEAIVLFVHGCCQPFGYHNEHAAFLGTWMRKPIVSYDWTSPSVKFFGKKIATYRKNEVLVQRNQDRFNRFLDHLEEEFPASKITVIAHSMGNRLVENAMLRRSYKQKAGKFNEVAFACADTDGFAFIGHLDKIVNQAKVIRLYMSKKDKLLRISQHLHGREPRLGSANERLTVALKPLLEQYENRLQVIDITALGLNHDLPLWVVSNIHKTGKPKNSKYFKYVRNKSGIFAFSKR